MTRRKLRQQFLMTYRPGTLDINGKFVTTVGGALVAASTDLKGVTSVTRTGAGQYTVRFDQPYLALVSYSAGVLQATTDGYKCWLAEDQVAGISGVYGGDGYVKLEVGQSTAATEMIDATVFLSFKVRTSTADA